MDKIHQDKNNKNQRHFSKTLLKIKEETNDSEIKKKHTKGY